MYDYTDPWQQARDARQSMPQPGTSSWPQEPVAPMGPFPAVPQAPAAGPLADLPNHVHETIVHRFVPARGATAGSPSSAPPAAAANETATKPFPSATTSPSKPFSNTTTGPSNAHTRRSNADENHGGGLLT